MQLVERFWALVTRLLALVTFSTFDDGGQQHPLVPGLGDEPTAASVLQPPTTLLWAQVATTTATTSVRPGPTFIPPGADAASPFYCDYTAMKGFEACSTPENRGCWLKNNATGEQYNITTDYETKMPQGIVRQYFLNVTEGVINADGIRFYGGKMFNNSYPGPWLQACWGDTLNITVVNSMSYNGTSIHWHGIRQLRTMHMDGVNGITQCPIAPKDYFVYKFNATQYGSSWYHSHYSVQYADGLVGPMTLHGPSSGNFDEAAKSPILMSDWGHNTAFNALYSGLSQGSILLNGTGSVARCGWTNTTSIPPRFTMKFEGQRSIGGTKHHLLRLINTSFQSTFVFSIDCHRLQIVSADFVPIEPYWNSSVLIGIGQRYNVIIKADPEYPGDADGNYWIRTELATCPGPRLLNTTVSIPANYSLSGILRYNGSSTADPTTKRWNDISLACSDEKYESLVPKLKWQVGIANNTHRGQEFDVVSPNANGSYPLASFALANADDTVSPLHALMVNFDNITFLHLNGTSWNASWVVIPENYNDTDWVYLAFAGDRLKQGSTGAHPLHLHGHDFAILQQEANMPFNIGNIKLKRNNPPRRDVVLLPRNGFVIIAFKTDNPGSWLMHCHIARHAAEGLGFQIMERRADADRIWPIKGPSDAIVEAQRVCANWVSWQNKCTNWWNGTDSVSGGCARNNTDPKWAFSPDSGI